MFFCSRIFCKSAVFDPVESWVFTEGFLSDSLFDEEALPLKKEPWFVGAGGFEEAVDLFEVFGWMLLMMRLVSALISAPIA